MIDLDYCPYPTLCHRTKPPGTSKGDYYIDFPVGRLAFVSSLSATISFTLVAAFMVIYSYTAARKLLDASDASQESKDLPSPHDIAVLVRLLNAEIFLLWGLLVYQLRQRFRRKPQTTQTRIHQYSPMVRASLAVLIAGIIGSLFIQVADTYFHVVISSVSATTLHPEKDVAQHQYSRRLASWCFDAEGSFGTNNNKFFWGCGLNATKGTGNAWTETFSLANYTTFVKVASNLDSYASLYTDKQGIGYAVARPPIDDVAVDWTGTGYAVSSQCTAIPPAACKVSEANATKMPKNFVCDKIYDGQNIPVSFVSTAHNLWFYDFHEYAKETIPFTNSWTSTSANTGLTFTDVRTIKNTTIQDSNNIFRNPWRWLSQIGLQADPWDLPTELSQSSLVWEMSSDNRRFFLSCSTMVWDASFAFAGDKVLSLSTTKSNGSVTGIVSMPSVSSGGYFTDLTNQVLRETNKNLTTPEAFVKQYELAMSKAYLVWLVTHTVPAPADLVQRRETKVITRLPATALWLLVAANLLFALFAVVLSSMAIRETSPEVHQVHTRLSTAGLAAQLFDWKHSRKPAQGDFELFQENNTAKTEEPSLRKRVGVRCTDAGGAEFAAYDFVDVLAEEANEAKPIQTTSVD
ncbi:hypothetical protein CC86DRAFT_470389 [Ophiobolus disseminans]|uniref:Uncharacterized protein n=1 Tax=Ophiobolus disseminans TaxID=1469910 RepID=A0A6A6ZN83_9PLEO|nr:hypothetical protein CC86DRAFT_470389 [Ophiobolus disseminans]